MALTWDGNESFSTAGSLVMENRGALVLAMEVLFDKTRLTLLWRWCVLGPENCCRGWPTLDVDCDL